MFFDEKRFGQRIKKLRVNKGLTQERMHSVFLSKKIPQEATPLGEFGGESGI